MDERSPEQLAGAIVRLSKDTALAEILADNALLKVNETFTRKASAQKFSCLFESLAEKK